MTSHFRSTSRSVLLGIFLLSVLFETLPAQETCDYSSIPGVVWWGTKDKMTLEEFASYAALVFWMSPDEPTMEEKSGKDITVPEVLPFETPADGPVVYYQFEDVNTRTDNQIRTAGYSPDPNDKGNGVFDLREIVTVRMKYIAYFSREEGLGGHEHDVEPTEVLIWVANSNDNIGRDSGLGDNIACDETTYVIGISRVTGEAHGLIWFYNVLETDEYVRFPMTMLVEEGKHGMSTDKNGDGIYTPGFDVSTRINDAWGVRDIIRGGTLFTGGYETWMAKTRLKEHRVFPPLPEDSPLRARHEDDEGVYAANNAIYELRPFPAASLADDELLHHKMEEKEVEDWPRMGEISTLSQFESLIDPDLALKSFAISLRYDGDLGIAGVFPFFIVKHLEDPMMGGFLVHRIYLKDKGFRDFGWNVMYMKSASRWIDPYISGGVEVDAEVDTDGKKFTKTRFVMESGIKFRVNVTKSPVPFLAWFTEYWGLRAGLQYRGFPRLDNLNPINYVFEIGAGVF